MTTTPAQPSLEGRDAPSYDVDAVRCDFPILRQSVRGKPLIYLDNAATTQKPQAVIDAITRYYQQQNANIHRGVHFLSEEATAAYEASRLAVQRFINAEDWRQIIFVRGCTEAINLVAHSWGSFNLAAGDEVLISYLEHHSNIVPWQILCKQTGARLRVVPVDDRGQMQFDAFERLLGERTKLVSIVQVSNAVGTVNPVERITRLAHAVGARVLVDGAQAVPHLAVDVQALGCDFYAFSGHKMYGPSGIGVLYGRRELLEDMSPYQTGGDMIKSVSFEKTIYNDLPYKFEAGTPNIVGPIGLAVAIDYLERVGLDRVEAYEGDLLTYATDALGSLGGVRLVGTAPQRAGVVSFVVDGVHAHDVGTIVDQRGVAIRTGHHCAQPLMNHFGVPATARASLGLYNSRDDIDALVDAVAEVIEVFR